MLMGYDETASRLSILHQLIEVCRSAPDSLLTASEIKRRVVERFGTNPSSVIPSDHCYNRWNRGIKIRDPLFVRVGTSEYRFIGPGQPFTGLIFGRPRGCDADQIVGEWIDGKATIYEQSLSAESATDSAVETTFTPHSTIATPNETPPASSDKSKVETTQEVAIKVTKSATYREQLPLSQTQLERLYEEYMEILTLEVSSFGCQPTETRHLIGRLGEFYCARLTHGRLASRVNQQGFDVVSETGKRISVKTTAQLKGFVSINAATMDRVDELMVLQYGDRDFEVVYHGSISSAITVARLWQGRYELDITKARRLSAAPLSFKAAGESSA